MEYNKHAFSVINEESAYWIGFLMADGCVYYPKRGKNPSPEMALTIQNKDRQHVEKFKSFLNSSHKISCPNNNVSFRIASRQLVDDLALYGVTERKSHTAEVRLLESNRHFWRGVMDGDGSLLTVKGAPKLQLVGNKKLLSQFVTFARQRGIQATLSIRPMSSIYITSCTGVEASKLASILYENSSVYLERKYRTYLSWSNYTDRRKTIARNAFGQFIGGKRSHLEVNL